jgi:amidophosphoribosyltransferase
MSGLFGVSINPKREKNVNGDLFWGTFYQQHLGEEYCGVSIIDQDNGFVTRVNEGHFRNAFGREEKIWKKVISEAIGCCGFSREPFHVYSRIGEFSVCFSGNILNADFLMDEFKVAGQNFVQGDEAELICKIIVSGGSFWRGMEEIKKTVKGSYSILVLTQEGLYVCSDGRWPLVIGKKEGVLTVATGSAGFGNLELELIDDVGSGILLLKDGEIKEWTKTESSPVCSFMWVYTGFPADVFHGVPASSIRKALGASLARKDIMIGVVPDLVLPVPDSGRFHAIGYHQEFVRASNKGIIDRVPEYDETLLKYPYAGRSFIPQSQEIRDMEASIKLIPVAEEYKNKKAVIVDDSIVRGTQARNNLVPKLRTLGLNEIYFRVGNPELISHCPWGKTTKQGEMLANSIPDLDERREYLDVDSLIYSSVNDLKQVFQIFSQEICMDCAKI